MIVTKVSATLVVAFAFASLALAMVAETRPYGSRWWDAYELSIILAILAFVVLATSMIWGL